MPADIHVVLVPEDDPRARAEPHWIVGRAFSPRPGSEPGDPDIEIFPARIAGYPYDSLESVLRHEIVHLALDARAGNGFLPRWFHEGVAEAIGSERGLLDEWQLLRATFSAPTMHDVAAQFESDEEHQTADAYRLAVALVDDVRRRHGADAPGRIAGRVAAGLPFDRAFLAETGETVEAAAARAWGVYSRASQWLAVLTSDQALWTFILLLGFVAVAVQLRRRARQRRIWDEMDGPGSSQFSVPSSRPAPGPGSRLK
jgi:hypothetical protein